MKQFTELKTTLLHIEDLRLIEPNVFLGPFLDVIRSEETTGPITNLALSAVNKFLSYGLIGNYLFIIILFVPMDNIFHSSSFLFNIVFKDPTHPALASTVENIADAVTHARFVGTDQASDGVVLMKIVQVLRTLMLNPEGSALTNESVCEVMLSCFRICFEPRLNELLRRTAEHALKDIVLLLFMRLPQFAEERHAAGIVKKLKMIAGSIDQTNKKRKIKNKISTIKPPPALRKNSIPYNDNDDAECDSKDCASPNLLVQSLKQPILATTPATPAGNIVDMQGKIMQTPTCIPLAGSAESINTVVKDEEDSLKNKIELNEEKEDGKLLQQHSIDNDADVEDDNESIKDAADSKDVKSEDFVNSMGVRFTPVTDSGMLINN